MTSDDVLILLPTVYRRTEDDGVPVLNPDTYVYGLTFNVSVRGDVRCVGVDVSRKGLDGGEIKVRETTENEYVVTDDAVLRGGNVAYEITVEMANLKRYVKRFYVKVPVMAGAGDVRVVSLSSYGLHENFARLRLVLNLETRHHVDAVHMYRGVDDGDWLFIGDMHLEDGVYVLDDLHADVDQTEDRRVRYRAVIEVSTGMRRVVEMLTTIRPASFSLNEMVAEFADDRHLLRGGVVVRVDSKLGAWQGRVAHVLVDATAEASRLRLWVDNEYLLYAEGFTVDFPKRFNPHSTDLNPNVYELTGKGTVHVIVDGADLVDTVQFSVTVVVGESTRVAFAVHGDTDDRASIDSAMVENSVVEYRVDGHTAVLDAVYEDASASLTAERGMLIYGQREWPGEGTRSARFLTDGFEERELTLDVLADRLASANVVTYTADLIYAIFFTTFGIRYLRFDGINLDETKHELPLYAPTLSQFERRNAVQINTTDDLVIRFFNLDGGAVLQRVRMVADELTVVDYGVFVNTVYTQLRYEVEQFMLNLDHVVVDDVEYAVVMDEAHEVNTQGFTWAGLDNHIQEFITCEFEVRMTYRGTVAWRPPGMSADVIAAVDVTVVGQALARVADVGPTVERTEISCHAVGRGVDLVFGRHMKRPNAPNIMELANGVLYLKFENALPDTKSDEYAVYRACYVYNRTVRLCTMPLEAAYGAGCTEGVYRYGDFASARVARLTDNRVLIVNRRGDGRLILVEVGLDEDVVRSVHEYTSSSVFDRTVRWGLGDRQLEHIVAGSGQFDTVAREMSLYAVTDLDDDLEVEGLASERRLSMNRIDNVVLMNNEKMHSYMLTTEVRWPLNVKNRNTMLSTPTVKGVMT